MENEGHNSWRLVLVLVITAILSAAFVGFAGTTAARADDSEATEPALAGLPDGSVYVAEDDGYWHYVDAATFAASGYDWSQVTWYGDLGTIATDTESSTEDTGETEAPVLAGLPDGSVYVAEDDGYWHYVDAATFAASGYDSSEVTWYGDLPGTIASDTESPTEDVGETDQPALAGLPDGSVYVAGDDDYWHYIDAATFAASGYDWSAVTWYGDLPGTVDAG